MFAMSVCLPVCLYVCVRVCACQELTWAVVRQGFVSGEPSCYSRAVTQLTGKMPARLKAAYISLIRKVSQAGDRRGAVLQSPPRTRLSPRPLRVMDFYTLVRGKYFEMLENMSCRTPWLARD